MSVARTIDPFKARDTFDTGAGRAGIYRLRKLEELGLCKVERLPFSMRVMLEAALRNCDGYEVTEDDVRNLAGWNAAKPAVVEIPFKPARVVLQDFTGVPCVVDLAAMRSAMRRLGGDPKKINPLIPVDLVIDHSVQVDSFGSPGSFDQNVELEFQRNRERYEFLRWGQKAFNNFQVVPPAVGIVHQVNLEFLASVRVPAAGPRRAGGRAGHPGGHRQPHHDDQRPGRRRLGRRRHRGRGRDARPAALHAAAGSRRLRAAAASCRRARPPPTWCWSSRRSCGRKASSTSSSSSSAPASPTCNWPIGPRSPTWPPSTAPRWASSPSMARRSSICAAQAARDQQVQLVERYAKEQGLFRTDDGPTPVFTKTLSLDLGTVEPSLAGPKRPQDRVPLKAMKQAFHKALAAPLAERGFALDAAAQKRSSAVAGQWPLQPDHARSCRDRRHHELHQHQQSLRHARRGPAGQEGGRQGPERQALREDQPRPRLPRGDRLLRSRRTRPSRWANSASTSSATAARRASATAARCPIRSRRP